MAKVTMKRGPAIIKSVLLLTCIHSLLHADPPMMAGPQATPGALASSALEKLTYQELAERRKEYTAKGDKEMVLKYAERMLKLCDEPKDLAELTLEVGDLYFEKGYLTEAEQYYSEFSLIFQGSDKAEYASYKSILCSFKRTYSIDRDQTKTEETIEMANKFLERKDFTVHAKEVEQIRLECYKKLAEQDIYVCDFYIKKGSLRSCERRFDTIKSEWLPKLPELAERVALLETSINDLRTAKGVSIPTLTTVATESVENPGTEQESTTVAANTSKKHMADRF